MIVLQETLSLWLTVGFLPNGKISPVTPILYFKRRPHLEVQKVFCNHRSMVSANENVEKIASVQKVSDLLRSLFFQQYSTPTVWIALHCTKYIRKLARIYCT